MMWIYELLSEVLHMSFMSSIVILAVLVIRLLFQRLPKLFRYVLWSVVLFRLLCPVTLSSSVSFFRVFGTPMEGAQLVQSLPEDNPEAGKPVSVPMDGQMQEDAEKVTVPASFGETKSRAEITKLWKLFAVCAWLLGVSIMMLYSICSLIRLRRKLIGALRVDEQVFLSDSIMTPFVIGILRPRIYLPCTLGEEEKPYIILHEQIHIKRGDHIFRALAFCALAIHWFNPLVWLAFYLSGVDMEMSCDEAVMKKSDSDIRAAYSTSLLGLSTGKRYFNGALLAFGEGNVKNRIKNVMKYKKPAFITIITAVLVVIVLVCTLGSNPKDGSGSKGDEPIEKEAVILEKSMEELQEEQTALTDKEAEETEKGIQEEEQKAKRRMAQLELWARAFCNRQITTIRDMMSEEALESMKESGLYQGGDSFGWSSPWPWDEQSDYAITEVTDSSAVILYYAWVSDPHITVWRETLKFHEEEGILHVDEEHLSMLDAIASGDEYRQAYPNGITGTPMDYLNTIMDGWDMSTGEILNANAAEEGNKAYSGLFSPDTAAVYLLNLLDNPRKVKVQSGTPQEDGSVPVTIRFEEDGEEILLKMIQPYGENGIWVVKEE